MLGGGVRGRSAAVAGASWDAETENVVPLPQLRQPANPSDYAAVPQPKRAVRVVFFRQRRCCAQLRELRGLPQAPRQQPRGLPSQSRLFVGLTDTRQLLLPPPSD